MDLKERVIRLLNAKKQSYASLAENLGLTEAELDAVFSSGPAEIRVLELVSKELQVPLYSFFRKPGPVLPSEPYYTNSIWEEDAKANVTSGKGLKNEIKDLKNELKEKDKLIRELKSQLRNT